jgi:hypothetical protein
VTFKDFVSSCPLVISSLAFCMSIFTVWINLRQKKLDNLLSLQQFLHQGDLSEARRSIREGHCEITLKQASVRRVCSTFDFAGTMVRNRIVSRKVFLRYWAIPLRALEGKLNLIANEPTGDNLTVKEYYRDFWWLFEQAKNVHLGRH